MQRIGGLRRKTRHLFTVPRRQKGKIPITKYMQEFAKGDKVKVLYNASIHKSPIKPRHFGKIGIVSKKRGECYEITIKGNNKTEKTLIIHPVHLQAIKNG